MENVYVIIERNSSDSEAAESEFYKIIAFVDSEQKAIDATRTLNKRAGIHLLDKNGKPTEESFNGEEEEWFEWENVPSLEEFERELLISRGKWL